jgi:heterodisulfide reductase subunit C
MASPKAAQAPQDIAEAFMQDVYKIPGGEKLKECLQCGTCSGSCPTAEAMDYTPREIIAAFRAGMLDRVLRSNTVWMCASCYECTVRCPAGIKLTDIMYELKRLGIQHRIYPKGASAPALSRIFVSLVDRYGRNPESMLLTRFLAQTNPLGLLRLLPLGIRFFTHRRSQLRPSRIKGLAQLRKIAEHAEQEEQQ